MSFDLWVWREEQPITTGRALLKLRWLTSDEEWSGPEPEMVPDDRVGPFHTEILSVYPPLEDVAEGEPGMYRAELREGSADRHYRCVTGDVDAAVSAFRGFADGRDDWKADFTSTTPS